MEVAADRSALGKGNRDGLFIPAEFGGKAAHEVDDHGSAAVCEFHVHPIGTQVWCHHTKASPKDEIWKLKSRYGRPLFESPAKRPSCQMQHGQELQDEFRGFMNGNLVSFDHSSRVQQADTSWETIISRANALKHQWHGNTIASSRSNACERNTHSRNQILRMGLNQDD
jgi:hypothetical protein